MSKLNGFKITETLYSTPSTNVFRAIRESDECPVILRTCDEKASSSQHSRLSSSAEILRGFDHPNIAKVIDIIDHSGQPWLIMADTHSIDLAQYLDTVENKQLPLDVFLNIAIQLAEALSVIHHAHVIHKDLHPGNIVINPTTQNIEIIDFGLASLLSREQPALAPPENLEGVISYISPEQTGRMNRSLDYRSDFYTLGVTLYQLLTGELPFVADDAIGLVHAHIARVQKPVSQSRPDIPDAVSDIIDKLMHKTAEERYQSAMGLKQDLEICRRHIVAGNPIPPFTLGLQDISDRFQVPQVLYGREQEVNQLMDSFYKAAQGQPQLLAVEGFAGIGKSALIHEVHKPIAAHSGIFTSGKFDQFQKNTPYSALKQAFSGWIQHALSLKESALNDLRAQLIQALGTNARVLIDFMDIFEVLLGDLAPLPTLGAQETQNRFHLVLQRFIQQITQQRPLVIFIDDLQWADRGTLNLLPQLMNAGLNDQLSQELSQGQIQQQNTDNTERSACRLLLLVAYRDNEVDDSHPAMQTLKQIQAEFNSANTLTLKTLRVDQINQLLVDALHQTPQATHALAELVEHKTGGNPFFVNEFLKTLYSEKLLNFDLNQQRWVWSLEAIKAQAITNNVVELMLGKMQQLPNATQHMLQLASCIGSLFDLQTLSIISEQDMPDTMRKLWPALKQGLLLQEGGDWLLGIIKTANGNQHNNKNRSSNQAEQDQPLKTNLSTRMSPLVPHCRFLHDRMLQAAYQSLTEDARQQAHLNIGRLLYKHTEAALLENQLFSIIEQLNQGRALIEAESEKLTLSQLNLQAAEKAKQASAWEAAARYAQIGCSLLPKSCWQNQYPLAYALHLIHIECEFLTANYDEVQTLAERLLQQVKTPLEKAQICLLLLSQQMQGNLNYCIEKGLDGLRFCSIQVPHIDEINDTLIKNEYIELKQLLANKNWAYEATLSLNKTTPTQISIAYRLYSQLTGACQLTGNRDLHFYIIYKGMRTALEHGQNEHALVLYAMYSALLAKQGKYKEANKVATTTLELLENYPKCADLPYINMVLGTFVWLYNHPIKESIKLQLYAHDIGYEYGDIIRGVLGGYSNSIINYYAQGLPLKQLNSHLDTLDSIIQRHNIKMSAGSYYRRLIKMLTQEETQNQLDATAFSVKGWQQIQTCIMKPFIEHLQIQWLFWSDQIKVAWYTVQSANVSVTHVSGFITSLEHRFIAALLSCKQLQQLGNQNDDDFFLAVNISLDELKELSSLCPENFEHKLLLLQAEQGRYQNQTIEELAPLYEAAIESASSNEFLQYEALANELYGDFLLAKSRTRFALPYIHDALNLYRHWGCTVKVKNLTTRYQALFQSETPQLSPQTTLLTTKYSSLQTRTLNRTITQTQTSSQEGLDLSSLMKSAQAISGELALKGLVSKVMLAILENSGAQNAALILESPTGAIIQAQIKAQNDRDLYNKSLEARPLNNATDLPVSLISYVLRTNTEQVLQEPTSNIHSSANDAFIEDPYLQMYQPKSVLCIPVSYREKLIGALYLENTLTHKAFPQERFDIIKMLLAQAAISFENARLFNEVTELNIGLEEKVKQRTLELDQSNQELDKSNQELNHAVIQLEASNKELETFSYSVSHDLRAPLRTIKGFSEILIEDYLDELDADAQMMLKKVMKGADNMGELISGLLDLSRMQRQELVRQRVNLSDMANYILSDMRTNDPERQVKVEIEAGIQVQGDQRMLQSVIENLLNNAWKYSSKTENAEITFATLSSKGVRAKEETVGSDPTESKQTTYFVKDNGAGFNMKYIDKLFATFQRLHSEDDFAGTGVGLATVKRIIEKHGGKIWAEAEVNKGATFYFTLG